MKATDPIAIFRDWYREAIDCGITEKISASASDRYFESRPR